MALFNKAMKDQAYLKAAFLGFPGDGKTFTASLIAIGLINIMREKKIEGADKPVFFIDTENGSHFVIPMFEKANIELFTSKTRSFVDLINAVKSAEKEKSILIIDSITHFWRVFTEEYAQRKKREQGLVFSDWAWLKKEWGRFTDLFINSKCHIIMCGRAGFEYDFFENAAGKKELIKTNIKMKAEGEMGFEPSLLIQMEKHRDLETNKIWRTALVVKDRTNTIDGRSFKNPTFKDFLPHIELLSLGGSHVGVDTTRNNAELFTDDGSLKRQRAKQQKEIALDEIVELLNKHYAGSTQEHKKVKSDLLEKHFGTRAWSLIQTLDLKTCQEARNNLWIELEGVPYDFSPPVAAEVA